MTGLTATIDEKTTLRDFAWTCAAFMSGHARETDAPLPEQVEARGAYKQEIESHKQKIAEIEAMSDAECREREQLERETEDRRQLESRFRDDVAVTNFRRVLAAVDAWIPPSPGHLPLKEFMQHQLTESIQHDTPSPDHSYGEVSRVVGTLSRARHWKQERIASLKEQLARYEELHKKEIERVVRLNDYLKMLRESIATM